MMNPKPTTDPYTKLLSSYRLEIRGSLTSGTRKINERFALPTRGGNPQ